MQATSFVAMTGHLNEYPLADVIAILRRQRKSGRLLIEYSISPCCLYFVEGNLVDAQLNSMGGLQAVLVALSQPNASFNFNPLIQPPRRSINESSQKTIMELLGCWEEKTIDVEATSTTKSSPPPTEPTIVLVETPEKPLLKAREVLALPPSSLEQASRRRNRQVLIASAIISLLVSFLTVAALTRWLIKRDIAAALSEPARATAAVASGNETAGTSAQTIKVAMRVQNGRVLQAFVEGHRPGMEAYEALALRLARGRRYAASATGQETVVIKIHSPD